MGKRAWLVLMVLFALVTGCAMFGPKSVIEPRWFYGNTMKFGLEREAAAIMDNAVKNYMLVVFNGKDDAPNFEKAIYDLYVKADKNGDHLITEEEAREFGELYQREFDNRHRTGPINFQSK